MPSKKTHVYVHLVWSTKNRQQLITSEIKEGLYTYILASCQELECYPLAIGGVADHVHLLVRLHYSVSMSQLLKKIKGVSSYLVNRSIQNSTQSFQWQKGYGAFSVNFRELNKVIAYIHNQEQHHQNNELFVEWEPS